MTSHDALMKKFDDLEVEATAFIVSYRKLKRDRKALLEACKRASSHFTPICDWRKDGGVIGQLDAAVSQAEAEE